MKPSMYHVLLALADGPSHGAEIRRRAREESGNTVALYPAQLYGTLDDLTDRGWIEEVAEPEGKAERTRWRFYALTPDGRRVLGTETINSLLCMV